MKKKFYLMIFSLIGLISCIDAQAQQKKVFLPYFEAINIKKDYQISATKLLRNYIELENKYQVVMSESKDTLFDADQPLAALKNKAMEMGADYFLKGSLNRIGESVIVNVTLIETATGNKIWFDQLKAMGPEDLDPIMQRIAKALGTDKKAANDNDIYAVTNNETAGLKQKQTNNSFGVGIGGMQILTPGSMQLTNLSAIWNFDARNFIMGIRTSLALNTRTDYYMFHLGLEMYRPHTTKSNTLFYGGGVGYSATDLGGSGSGMSLNAGGGYLINRNSAASFQLGLNYFYSLFLLSNNQSPMGLELRAAIFFNQ
jgi:hypothetical protein